MAKYELITLIGEGGFGKVFKAKHIENGDKHAYAIKQIASQASEEDKKRFHREVKIQSKLRHKNIVPIIEQNTSVEPYSFVMPIAQSNLRDYLAGKKGDGLINIFYEIANGLEYAHQNGVIHRDLKPENVLIFKFSSGEERIAIGDFGLGRLITRESPSITQTNIRMGTIEYMAPEQYADAKNANTKADIYSLGKILFEILTGDIPYPIMDYSKVPSKFEYIVRKASDTDPDKRYQTINEMVNDIKTVMFEEDLLTKPAELIRNEVQEIIGEQNFSAKKLERLAKLLTENTDDVIVMTDMMPKLPDPILGSLLANFPSLMAKVLRDFDGLISEGLPFEYCDIVADFYKKVFEFSDYFETKLMIIKRLPFLGCRHNRFHVGEVFAELISNLKDKALILAARDILKEDGEVAEWCKTYLEKYSMPSVLKSI